MKSFLVRGVPQSLQQDGWWMASPSPSQTASTPSQPGGAQSLAPPGPWVPLALLGLLALCDRLVWGVAPGLSLALLPVIAFAAAVLFWPGRVPASRLLRAAVVLVASALPLIEQVQPLSIGFALLGFPVALALLADRPLARAWQYWGRVPWIGAGLALCQVRAAPEHADLAGVARVWGLPVLLGGVFGGLLLAANPVLDQFFARWVFEGDLPLPDPDRLVLWALMSFGLWPSLTLAARAADLFPMGRAAKQGPRRVPQILNAPALMRALFVCNLLFAVQNLMDLAYLAGGLRLPDGITYAEYAHRGAYPLVVLALLSGAFAIVARPLTHGVPELRILLLIWIAQTIWLTCSSGLRLDLYIDTYGLTRLRLAAAIWMWLVAAGLALILVQVARNASTGWLLRQIGAVGLLTLYLCAFISADRMIAAYNLSHDVPQDRWYLCTLGEAAIPEIVAATGQAHETWCAAYRNRAQLSVPEDWRAWGFRNARVRRSLAALGQGTTQ